MRSDPRLIKNIRSTKKIKELLEQIIATPDLFSSDHKIVKSLNSQGALAKLTIEKSDIFASSLNTLKRVANSEITGGFHFLDSLRLRAKNSLGNLTPPLPKKSQVTQERLSGKNADLQRKLKQAQQDCWRLTIAFNKAMSQAQRYAINSKDETIIALCRKEQKELRAMFSLVSNSSI